MKTNCNAPQVFFAIGFMLLFVLTGCAHHSPSYEIARNPDAPVMGRESAAAKLGENERSDLRKELLKFVPGEWDVKTANAIGVLGVIGDDATKRAIEDAYEQSARDGRPVLNGPMLTVIDAAITKISRRSNESASQPGHSHE